MHDIILNLDDAGSQLSQHLNGMTPHERIVICSNNQPVAEVRLLPTTPNKPRKLGVAEGEFTVADSFFEPLPDELFNY